MSTLERTCSAQTVAGRPCRGVAMHGSDRCASHQGLAGRKSILTPELTAQLAAAISAGNYLAVACRAVGLSRDTFKDWMRRGQSELPVDAPFRDFRARIEEARAKGEVRNVATIAKAAKDGSWQAAAWLLERQHPTRWGRPSVREREALADEATGDAGGTVETEADPFREVDELAAKRATRSGG